MHTPKVIDTTRDGEGQRAIGTGAAGTGDREAVVIDAVVVDEHASQRLGAIFVSERIVHHNRLGQGCVGRARLNRGFVDALTSLAEEATRVGEVPDRRAVAADL